MRHPVKAVTHGTDRTAFVCLVKSPFREWAWLSFGLGHETISGFAMGTPLVFRLAQHERRLEPMARAAKFDEPAVVDDAVYDRGGELVVREDGAPFRELHVC